MHQVMKEKKNPTSAVGKNCLEEAVPGTTFVWRPVRAAVPNQL